MVDIKHDKIKLVENLLNMIKSKEEKDKQLLILEYVIGYSSLTTFLILIFSFIQFFIAMFFGIRIEQIAGYYECSKCHHKYIPTYNSVLYYHREKEIME